MSLVVRRHRPRRRPRSPRALLLATLAITLAVTGTLATTTTLAQAAPGDGPARQTDYWFGDLEQSETFFGGRNGHFVSLNVTHPTLDFPLPFHSTLRGVLYDCDGRPAFRRWGSSTTIKQSGRPWRVSAGFDLNPPPTGGPYARWVVTVRSKGRQPVRHTVTDGGSGFRLGCGGGYRRSKDLFWGGRGSEAGKPLNADFRIPVARSLKRHVRSFGRPFGAVRVGGQVGVRGARDHRGTQNCGVSHDYTWPERPQLAAGIGTMCDDSYGISIDRTLFFVRTLPDGRRRTVEAPARGKRLTMTVNFHRRGHDYQKQWDMGIIR